ncbi:MAG: YcgN family cysteine cluster protein [Pseudohongiellaceae bacterium]
MADTQLRPKFWELPLDQLNRVEWEQLCDGCGRCCLKKLADEDSDELLYTRVVCRYFDEQSSRCGCYSQRTVKVSDCLDVAAMNLTDNDWMPDSCAYKLRYQGLSLFDWHPLIAGSRAKMEEAGILLKGRVISEEHVHPDGYDEHIIRWVKA